jgi:hypothetical protein
LKEDTKLFAERSEIAVNPTIESEREKRIGHFRKIVRMARKVVRMPDKDQQKVFRLLDKLTQKAVEKRRLSKAK